MKIGAGMGHIWGGGRLYTTKTPYMTSFLEAINLVICMIINRIPRFIFTTGLYHMSIDSPDFLM
jgi:hypothetical protein